MTILTGTLSDFTAIGPAPLERGYLRIRLDSFDSETSTREWNVPILAGAFATQLPELSANGSLYLRAEGVPGFPSVHVANYDGLSSVTLTELLTAINPDGSARFIIDPRTLAPLAPLPPTASDILTLAVQAAQDARDTEADAARADTSALQAAGSADSAAASKDSAKAYRDEAVGVADSSVVNATKTVSGDQYLVKLNRKNGADIDLGDMRGAQGLGAPFGSVLTTQDLNDMLTPGFYRQPTGASANVARNYPYEGNTGLLEVFNVNGAAGLIQRYTAQGGASGNMRGFYQRRRSGTTWDAWQYIARQRVDNTAGRAIYTWDDVNGRDQLIYGDTGFRNVAPSNATKPYTAGNISLRRVGQTVQLVFADLVLDPSITGQLDFLDLLPIGFRPTVQGEGINTYPVSERRNRLIAIAGTTTLRISGVDSYTLRICANMHWFTNDPWPTTLPGVASGTIPNL